MNTMIKRSFLPLIFLTLLCQLSPLCADTSSPSPRQEQIDAIDADLRTLTQSLQKLRAKALNNEIDAQPLLFDDWDKFAEKIEANEEDEKKILKLKKEIDALKEKKRVLEQEAQKR